ncbi:hypothetical protein WJX79_005783 [Trebouxia sp. C0005]
MRHARGFLLVCFLCLVGADLSAVKLSDSTFERVTQASTGQTTGHWFVLFTCPEQNKGESFQQLRNSWEDLAEGSWHESYGFQVAEVDTCHSPGLKERFGIEDTAIILFRDRQMYKYANPIQKGANSKGVLQQFALKGYEYLEALPVPQPQSFWAAAMKELFSTQLGVMPVAVLTLGLVGAMFVFFVLLNQRRVSAVIQQQKRK